jgi:hypothetical protein
VVRAAAASDCQSNGTIVEPGLRRRGDPFGLREMCEDDRATQLSGRLNLRGGLVAD